MFIWSCFLYWFQLNYSNPRMKWGKNKRQFKNVPSSICLDSLERRMVDVPISILTEVTFYYWIFCFHMVKPLVPLLSILCVCEKLYSQNKQFCCGDHSVV